MSKSTTIDKPLNNYIRYAIANLNDQQNSFNVTKIDLGSISPAQLGSKAVQKYVGIKQVKIVTKISFIFELIIKIKKFIVKFE